MTDSRDVATAPTLAAASIGSEGAVVANGHIESEEARWDHWKAKGRADDLRFRRGLRRVVVDVAAVIALCGAFWLAFQF